MRRAPARAWLSICLCWLAFVLPVQAQDYRWRNVVIGGGGFVSGLVFHPAEQGLLYARTDIGGAYRWEPAEQQWTPLLDWMGEDDRGRFGVESLALDPSDPDRLYLAVGTYLHARGANGAILRSRDRGRTFERAELPFRMGGNEQGRGNGERLAVDPHDRDLLLLGTRAHGLWRSRDGGMHWAEVEAFPAAAKARDAWARGWRDEVPVGIAFVVFEPRAACNSASTVYAGVSTQGTSLYRSSDGGASWEPVAGQPTGLRPSHMVRDARGRWLLSYGDEPGPNHMADGAVYRFDPADGSWTDITPLPRTPGRASGFGWGAVAVQADDADVIVASTFRRYQPGDDLYRSLDGGRSWAPMFARSRFDHAQAPWTQDAKPHWMADIEIDPHDPERIWFVTGYGVWASRDARAFDAGGLVRWEFPQAGFEETVPLALLSPPRGPHLVSGLGDVDGFVHDRLDAAQQRFTGVRFSNTESLAMAAHSPLHMARTGYFHNRPAGAIRGAWSEDGGRHWTVFASEPPEGDGAGRIVLSADGRHAIWRPRNAQHHWLGDPHGRQWRQVRGLGQGAVVEADQLAPDRFYAFDATAGRLLVSSDGGATFAAAWTLHDLAGADARVELRPLAERRGEGWLAAGPRGLWRWSLDGAVRIAKVEDARSIGLGAPADAGGAPVIFLHGRVASSVGLHRSDDSGASWRRIDHDGMRSGGIVRHVTGDPRLHGRVYFGTEGRGIWYGDPQ